MPVAIVFAAAVSALLSVIEQFIPYTGSVLPLTGNTFGQFGGLIAASVAFRALSKIFWTSTPPRNLDGDEFKSSRNNSRRPQKQESQSSDEDDLLF
ncbi:hypothetical protein [Salipiger abyssi]|uniref:hypothetical protein n=1 Tax=Salipiger abyssi TaxID=1250539 RepID=UPI0009781BD7|nr:hypothetical protein [Salipiger abyssi]